VHSLTPEHRLLSTSTARESVSLLRDGSILTGDLGQFYSGLYTQVPRAFSCPPRWPNQALQRTPLRVERDRSDFDRRNLLQWCHGLSVGAAKRQSVGCQPIKGSVITERET
jgi:hypothetical protein